MINVYTYMLDVIKGKIHLTRDSNMLIRINGDLHQWLKRYALYKGTTMSEIIVDYLETLRAKEGDVVLIKQKPSEANQQRVRINDNAGKEG